MKKDKDIKKEKIELEDGSDMHMNTPMGEFKPRPLPFDEPFEDVSKESEEESETKTVLVPHFKILDSFISDIEASIGSLSYNHTIQVINDDRILNLTIGNFLELIKDTKESVDIHTLSFICECLTYYPYLKVKDIIHKIKEDQSSYFTEIEPKEIEVEN